MKAQWGGHVCLATLPLPKIFKGFGQNLELKVYINIFCLNFSLVIVTISYMDYALWPVQIHNCFRNYETLRHLVGLLGQEISPTQDLYIHRTAQHTKTTTNIHALSGIRSHELSVQVIEAYATDRATTGTCLLIIYPDAQSRTLMSLLKMPTLH
jgi:hypothetical protein